VGGGLAFEKKKKRRMGTALKFDFSSRPTTKKQKEGLCLLLCLIDEICFCFFFSILFCKKIIINKDIIKLFRQLLQKVKYRLCVL
jgi:hypothetical protein